MSTGLAQHLAGAVDPVILAGRIGLDPDDWQRDVLRDPRQRELLVVHRQGGKSATAAIAAVHAALYEPGAMVLVVSPSQRQSQELFRKIITLYRTLGRPVAAETENQLSLTLENGSRIVALPADPDTIRGYSAVRLLIIDEAAFVGDATMAAVSPVLAVSQGRMLAMSTPFGRRGWFYEASKSSDWRVTTVTAHECKRINAEFLESERQSLGEWRFKQEYECQFIDTLGRMFSTDDILAVFRPGLLGAIERGALFGSAAVAAVKRIWTSAAETPTRCRRSTGHFWRDRNCVHCGVEKAEQVGQEKSPECQ